MNIAQPLKEKRKIGERRLSQAGVFPFLTFSCLSDSVGVEMAAGFRSSLNTVQCFQLGERNQKLQQCEFHFSKNGMCHFLQVRSGLFQPYI